MNEDKKIADALQRMASTLERIEVNLRGWNQNIGGCHDSLTRLIQEGQSPTLPVKIGSEKISDIVHKTKTSD